MTIEKYALVQIHNMIKDSIEDADKQSKEYSDNMLSQLAYEVGILRGTLKSVISMLEIVNK
jgi:Na+/citrate or Na+/malate symporter